MDITNSLELSSPWEHVHHMLEAFFSGDPDVRVDGKINYSDMSLGIVVDTFDKYKSLKRVLKQSYVFGNNVLKINIIYPEDLVNYDIQADMEIVLENNPLFSKFLTIQDHVTGAEFNYCIFQNEVVQYYDDRLDSPYGVVSTLAQEIAKEIFDTDKILYTTEVINS